MSVHWQCTELREGLALCDAELKDDDKLKNCPFCGGSAEFEELDDEANFGGLVVTCLTCLACSRVQFGENRMALLLEAWNRRAVNLEDRAQLADAIAFVRKAGHLPGCGVSVCQHRLPGGLSGHCGGTNDQPQHRRVSFAIYKHDFQPGECTCGHDRIAGSEGEG